MQRQKAFGRLAAFYLFVVCCLGMYAIYLWYQHAFLAILMTAILMLVATSFAFKEHFWYMQMRQRRLGLTLKEWFLLTIGRAKTGNFPHE